MDFIGHIAKTDTVPLLAYGRKADKRNNAIVVELFSCSFLTEKIQQNIKPVCTKCSWTLLQPPTDFVQPDSPPLLSDRVGGWESRSALKFHFSFFSFLTSLLCFC